MKTSQSSREGLAWERFRSRDAAQNKLFSQQRPRLRSPEPSLRSNARGSPLRGFSKVMMLIHGFEDHV